MENYIIAAVVLVIVGLAVLYIVRAKKSGKKCIGCPAGGCSSKSVNGCCCCHSDTQNKS
ncbi:MAG: FeoB-associated Cys-rich membrane protein [Clostridia bacterium]|nr:FeoB-associated Cys-rich membrane protein [Clostridia bacterium]